MLLLLLLLPYCAAAVATAAACATAVGSAAAAAVAATAAAAYAPASSTADIKLAIDFVELWLRHISAAAWQTAFVIAGFKTSSGICSSFNDDGDRAYANVSVRPTIPVVLATILLSRLIGRGDSL